LVWTVAFSVAQEEFEADFVIVGAGTSAGPVLYYLPPLLPHKTFVVIERGFAAPNLPLTDLQPGKSSQTFNNELAVNNFYSLEDPVTGLGSIAIAVAQIAGGGSKVNQEEVYRGNKLLYDKWGEGWTSLWNWDSLLPGWIKLENFTGTNIFEPAVHGFDGPINTYQEPIFTDPSWATLVQSAQNVFQLPLLYDDSDGFNIGIEQRQRTYGHNPLVWDRQDAWNRLIFPATQNYPNVKAILNASVIGIDFTRNWDGKLKATGVKYLDGVNVKTIKAKAEVIVSAGAINTAKLLLLSGIGNCTDLEALGIDCLKNLPGVGLHLQNQLFLFTAWIPSEPFGCSPQPPLYDISIEYEFGTPTGYPNAHVEVLNSNGFFYVANMFDYSTGFDSYQAKLTLASKNPTRQPIVVLNSFPNGCSSSDLDILADVFTKTSLWFSNFSCPWVRNTPDFGALPADFTQAELKAWICSNVESGFHYAGTTKMDKASNPLAVVDDKLIVYGTENLRLIDLSIAPNIPASHTMLPSYGIGWNGKEIVRRHYGV